MPPPAPGEVQIRTEFSVVSTGTERWAFRRLFTWADTPFPCVPGYQRVGTVTDVGEGVTGISPGQRAMATVGAWDGPVRPHWGSHIALANSPGREVFPLPPETEPLDAAGAVVAQVGWNAASRLALKPGEWVLVYGDGLIGQCAAQAARARGFRALLVGRHDDRLRLAALHSADAVVCSRERPVADAVRAITGTATVAAVLDSVQSKEAQREYAPLLPTGGSGTAGQIVYCGFTPGTVWADMALLQQRELTAHFVSGWTRSRMEATLELMAAGQLRVAPLLTHRTPYTDAPALYRLLVEKSSPFLGLALDWRSAP
jgi:2-desacetyl-2-hydroxyethyl bacteriochlorophyllide A dehydrogenase